jgi:hypothetical protein
MPEGAEDRVLLTTSQAAMSGSSIATSEVSAPAVRPNAGGVGVVGDVQAAGDECFVDGRSCAQEWLPGERDIGDLTRRVTVAAAIA